MKQLKRVLIMAGGTGGHVFPGLALAACLKEQGVEVHWLGTTLGLEADLVPKANIPFHTISIGGLRGKGIKPLLGAPFKITKAVRQAASIIKKINPDVVVGLGGFVSGPGGLASWLLRYPLVIHEQNAKAGLTNQILARLAKRVLLGFPEAFKPSKKVLWLGNPVRATIDQLMAPANRGKTVAAPLRLLVLGGSLGAKTINECLPEALALLSQDERPEVWHQTGAKHYEQTNNNYKNKGLDVKLQPFIEDMKEAYHWADVVLCRAGALTVAELCAAGVGAIFIPYPYAVDDHQTANANFMVKHVAALCIQEKELTEAKLVELVKQFTASPDKLVNMANAAYQLRQKNVAEKMVTILAQVVEAK